jgi:subtilisin family serine protease
MTLLRALAAALALAVVAGSAVAQAPPDATAALPQVLVTFRQAAPVAPRTGPRAKYVATPNYTLSAEVRRAARAIEREHGLREVDAWPIGPLGVHCIVYEVTGARPLADVLASLSSDPRVESAQPLHLFDLLASTVGASDGVALSESGYDDPYLDLQHSVRDLQVEAAQRWASGRGVDVAIIDTGVDAQHPELAGRIALVQDFVEPRARRGEQHGTAVAGIIGAAAGNGIGIIGVAPDVRLLALRACWPMDVRSVCSSFTLAKALTFALERSPQIINLSLAGPDDPLLARLLALVVARGITVVAACRADDCTSFPASVPQVIAVSNIAVRDPSAALAAGRPAPLRAPGVDVLTTMPNGAFDFVSGSSISAAHVSGIVALLLQRRPDLSPDSLREALSMTMGPDVGSVVNACEAVAAVVDGAGCPARGAVAGRG